LSRFMRLVFLSLGLVTMSGSLRCEDYGKFGRAAQVTS